MREEFPKSGENAWNPEVSVEAGTEPPKKKVDSNVCVHIMYRRAATLSTIDSNEITYLWLIRRSHGAYV